MLNLRKKINNLRYRTISFQNTPKTKHKQKKYITKFLIEKKENCHFRNLLTKTQFYVK